MVACMIVVGACVRLSRSSRASRVASLRFFSPLSSAVFFFLLFVLHAAVAVVVMEPAAIAIYDQIVASARARSDQRFYQDVAKVRVGRCRHEICDECEPVILHYRRLRLPVPSC